MIYAYDKVYLRIAQRSLGEMLSYAVYDLGYELEDYYKRFLQSEYSMRFSKGDLFVITGMSGAELAIRVLDIPDDDIDLFLGQVNLMLHRLKVKNKAKYGNKNKK